MSYGCYNRPPHAEAEFSHSFYAWGSQVFSRLHRVSNRNSRDCQYTHTTLGAADPGCVGCSWRRGQLELKLWEDKDPNFR